MPLSPSQEKRARAFFQTLLEKGHVERARSFCQRDELDEALRAELLTHVEAHVEAHLEAKKQANDAVETQDQRMYGELRSLLEAESFDQATRLLPQLSNPDLRGSAQKLIEDKRRQVDDKFEARIEVLLAAHEWEKATGVTLRLHDKTRQVAGRHAIEARLRAHLVSLNSRLSPSRFLALNGGGVFVEDDTVLELHQALQDHAGTWNQSASGRLQHVSMLRSLDGASERLRRHPEAIVEVISPFHQRPILETGRGRYSWWPPDEQNVSSKKMARKVAATGTTLSPKVMEGRQFTSFVDELTKNGLLGSDDFIPADLNHVLEWLRHGGALPALNEELDTWNDEEREEWQRLLGALSLYARAVLALDDVLEAFFEGEDVMRFDLTPDEDENYAWNFEALLGAPGVVLLGYFHDL